MVLKTSDKISPYTGAALQEYSRTRNKDVEAMCDLAMYNYIEVFCQCDTQNGGSASVLGNASAGYSHFGAYRLIGV